MPKKPKLPDPITDRLAAIEGLLADVTQPAGRDLAEVLNRLEEEASGLVRAAALHGRQQRAPERQTIPLVKVTGNRLREHRETAGWTQARLAEAMGQMGFGWSRVTVAEVEAGGGRRRLAFEELVALAALFGQPAVAFLLPADNENVALPSHERGGVAPEVMRELLVGSDGRLGSSAERAGHYLTGSVLGEDDWTPSSAYEARLNEQQQQTLEVDS